MDREALFARYEELKAYIGWTEADAAHVRAIGRRLEPQFDAVVADFYDEIGRHPAARKVLTGGDAQIQRLKTTLRRWVCDLFLGQYDADYVERRWRVGLRHAEIGLDQVYCNVAMCRIRTGLQEALHRDWDGDHARLAAASLARVPLTERHRAPAVLFCAGRSAEGDAVQVENWATLLAGGTSLVLYMGLKALTAVAPRLRAALPPGTQVEVTAVAHVSLPGHRQVSAPLASVEADLEAAALPQPVVFILTRTSCGEELQT